MIRTRNVLGAFAITTLLLAACGDDGGDDSGASAAGDADTPTAEASNESGTEVHGLDGEWPPAGLPGDGAAGVVSVDGVDYPIDVMRLCDVSDYWMEDGEEPEMLVQGAGSYDPEDEFADTVQVEVLTGTDTRKDAPRQVLNWNGPEGIYDERWSADDLPLEIDSYRITGSASLRSHLGNPAVDVEVDIALPGGEPVDCGF